MQMGRGTTQPQPIVFATQGVPMMAQGRGGPILGNSPQFYSYPLVQQQPQPQVVQPQQIRVAPQGQPFQQVMFMQPHGQQPPMQPVVYAQNQPQHFQQQPPPPSYTQSQAQRSVFPENPYGNLGPGGY